MAIAVLSVMGMAIAPGAACQLPTISVSADPGALVVTTAVAGSPPLPVSDATTTYSVTGILLVQKITAALATSLPPGVTLEIELEAPPGAVSSGRVALSTAARTVVQNIPPGVFSGLAINYYFTATTAAGVVPRDVRDVILTLAP